MSLRTRAVVVILITAALALATFVLVADRVVGDGFADLEMADASERIDRALSALSADLDRQLVATRQVALSPDTRELIAGLRSELWAVNRDLGPEGVGHDALVVLDPLGRVLYQVGVEELPAGIRNLTDDAILRLPEPGRSDVRGIGTVGGDLASIVAHRVALGDETLGTVVSVDLLTQEDIAAIAGAAFIDLDVTPYPGRRGFAAAPFEAAALTVATDATGAERATTHLTDSVGLFVLSVSSDVPQAIADAGTAAYRRLVLLIVVVTLLVTAATVLWFERYLLSRIAKLSDLVDRSAGADREPVRIEGGDELASLAEHIESTLRSLEAAQAELEATNEELAVANELKDDFVSMVSHEFRTPLTSIRGYTETMLRHAAQLDEEQRRAYTERVLAQSLRLARMVDDLLTLAQASKGTMHMDPGRVSLVEVASETVETLGAAGVRIDVPEDAVAYADEDHVRRILTNYVENALKYGAAPIRVTGRRVGDRVELRVSDAGAGVPAAFQEQLFERFTQASVGTQRTAKGVGLGLSIVHRLAVENDGVVWFEPNDPGATFGVRLPAASRVERAAEAPAPATTSA